MHDFITTHPVATAYTALAAFLIFAALLIRKACLNYKADAFDPLAQAGYHDDKPWYRTTRREEPRPSDEGTGRPRPYDPAADVSHSNIGPGIDDH